MSKKRQLIFIVKWFLFLAIVFAVNVISSYFPVHKDFTEGKLYTLSSGTVKLLNSVDENVTIYFYTSDSSHRMPPKLFGYSKRIRDLLRDFKRKNITVKIINPNDSVELTKQAIRDGMKTKSLVDGTTLYLGMAIASADKRVAIPFLFQEKEHLLEYELSRAIALVAKKDTLTIGVMSSFYVLGHRPTKEEFKAGAKVEPIWYFFQELAHEARLMQLSLKTKKIPDNVDTLVLVNPAGITRSAAYAIDQYLLKGGKVVVCVDPRSVFAGIMANKNNDVNELKKMASNLPNLFKAWGVEYSPSVCVSDMTFAMRKKDEVTYPTILEINSTGINRTEKATRLLEKLTLCLVGPLRFNGKKGLQATSLITSTKNTQLVSSFIANKPSMLVRLFKSDHKQYDLGMLLSGNFKTAFPRKVIRNGGVAEGNKGKVAIISDADFLMNSVCVKKNTDSYGGDYYITTNDNIAFLENVIDQLNGCDYFIESRSKVYSSRPFLKVLDIRSKAELKYKEGVLKLEKQYLDAERKKGGMPNRYLTKSEKDKILAKHATELSNSIKILRTQLSQEESVLKRNLQWFNFLFSPILVVLLFSLIVGIKVYNSKKS